MVDLIRWRRRVLALYLAGMALVTLAPVSIGRDTPDGLDKVVHLGLFAGLAALLYWNLERPSWARRLNVIAIAAAFAGVLELLQIPIPHRTGDVGDFVAGSLGAVLGAVTATFFQRWESSPGETRESH